MNIRRVSVTAVLLVGLTLAGCSAEAPESTACLGAIDKASTAESAARASSEALSTVLSGAATQPPAEFGKVAAAATTWASDLDALAARYDAIAPLTVQSFGDAALAVSSAATSAAADARGFATAAQAYSVSADETTTAALNAAAADIAGAPGTIAAALDRVSDINTNSEDICE